MALTYSSPPKESDQLVPFRMIDTNGKWFTEQDFQAARVLVVMFICNHCPYVQAIEDRLISLGKFFKENADVEFIAVCSNDSTDHPEDSPEALKKRAIEKSYPFPYLIDSDQSFAKTQGALCTPDFFVFDEKRRLAYRGRLDDSWKNSESVTKEELKEAIDSILAGSADGQLKSKPSMGCSIKWKQ